MSPVNLSCLYAVTTVISLLLAVGYGWLVTKKSIWLMYLHVSVVIVNLGYFALSISKTLEEALLANRISYFGSVFLPLCMLMTILEVCQLRYRKWMLGFLLCCSIAVFILAASPGYLTCYYQEVSLIFINGMAKLDKVYGPLHFVYLLYLVGYFGAMLGVILFSVLKKRLESHKHAILLLTIVLLNIMIWYVEQLIYCEFEFLAVSYIISEFLLLLLYAMMQDFGILVQIPGEMPVQNDLPEIPGADTAEQEESVRFSTQCISEIVSLWSVEYALTGREGDVLAALLLDKKRKDIAAEMCVTEHTIKKHTGNIFSKLDVSNRSELFAKAESVIV